jgi:hypothetical protein
MPLKIQAASPEEHAFAAKVNKRLAGTGAKINAFSLLNSETQESTYHLTFQYGPKRHTIQADAPFHTDSVDDVVDRVKRWLASSGSNNLYSPDPKFAEDRELM